MLPKGRGEPKGNPRASPDRGQGAHGPLQGFGGSAPKVLPLTLGAALQEKRTAQYVRRPSSVSARHFERRPQERPQAAAHSKIPKVRKAWLS